MTMRVPAVARSGVWTIGRRTLLAFVLTAGVAALWRARAAAPFFDDGTGFAERA